MVLFQYDVDPFQGPTFIFNIIYKGNSSASFQIRKLVKQTYLLKLISLINHLLFNSTQYWICIKKCKHMVPFTILCSYQFIVKSSICRLTLHWAISIIYILSKYTVLNNVTVWWNSHIFNTGMINVDQSSQMMWHWISISWKWWQHTVRLC